MIISIKLNCSKIEKDKLFKGAKGTYLDLVCMSNRDGKDEFGNDGFVAHSLSKEQRMAGEKGSIIGNFKIIKADAKSAPAMADEQPDEDGSGDVAF